MSFVVSVAVTVSMDDVTYVNVGHSESVLPAALPEEASLAIEQRDLDLVDLVRAALSRIASEVNDTADTQIVQLRSLLEGLV